MVLSEFSEKGKKVNNEKFTADDLRVACNDLATLPFFPQEAKASVVTYLARMCPHKRALRWLVDEVVNHVRSWPGLAELRGILCNRFDPADGIDQWSTLPGYRAEDNEARYLEGHEEQKRQELNGSFHEDLRNMAAAKQLGGPNGKIH
jgi:hypothetical protein